MVRAATRIEPTLAPMLATAATAMPTGEGWAFEPKYDGIRILAFATPTGVRLQSRNGIDKCVQFPEIAEALHAFARERRTRFVLDGELVARDGAALGRFEALQGRIHASDSDAIADSRITQPVTLVLFDLLLAGAHTYIDQPWTARRQALVALAEHLPVGPVQIGTAIVGDGAPLLQRARRDGWEGIIAKRIDGTYRGGTRTRDWLKLKTGGQQEFVIGGWTEPRNSRPHLGALLLGVWKGRTLHYAGHVGSGFSHAMLGTLIAQLESLEQTRSPFAEEPATNQPAHWVRPVLVAEVRFNEWTSAGHLRQPVFLGLRTDKKATDITREPLMIEKPATADAVVAQLAALEANDADGAVQVNGHSLDVTNLGKLYFPKAKRTKGDLLRFYASIAPLLLPHLDGRPLVLRRYPGGAGKPGFFQQKAPDDLPDGVRTADVEHAEHAPDRRLVGGDLVTLLYCAQLGGIDMNPWHSRIGSLDLADYSVLDLDPGPRASFKRVVEVARWTQEALAEFGLHGALKTSGASGLHIFVPLPAGTSYDTSLLLAQLVATRVAVAHPKAATVLRSIKARPTGSVYVDYLQNVQGKSVASVFCVRAQPQASVSAPLAWSELDDPLDPRDFTMERVLAERVARARLWNDALARPVRLDRVVPP